MRRYTPLHPSRGTLWPPEVRKHVATHQPLCLGAYVDMPGDCAGASELDHVRASHGTGMKSDSIAVNGAQLCYVHHRLKTEQGKTWRPPLIQAIARLHGECARCQRESIETYGVPLEEVTA
jgi:hypothetical protein